MLLAIIGLGLIVFGIINLYKLFFRRTIAKFDVGDMPYTFDLSSTGWYAILVEKNKNQSMPQLKLMTANKLEYITLMEKLYKFTFIREYKIWLEYRLFYIEQTEQFELMIHTDEKIEYDCPILIIKSIPNLFKVLSILSLVVGVNLFCWGIILFFYQGSFMLSLNLIR